MTGLPRTLRVEHHLDLDTLAKILFACELPAQPNRRDVRRAVAAVLLAHGRIGALDRYDQRRRDATPATTGPVGGGETGEEQRERLAACRRLAEHAFPLRRPKGRSLIEVLFPDGTP